MVAVFDGLSRRRGARAASSLVFLLVLLSAAPAYADQDARAGGQIFKDTNVFNVFKKRRPAPKVPADTTVVHVPNADESEKDKGNAESTKTEESENAEKTADAQSDVPSDVQSGAQDNAEAKDQFAEGEKAPTAGRLKSPAEKDPILPPDQLPFADVDPEAPSSFRAMVESYRSGDIQLAKEYADQFVRYMTHLMFEVRAMSSLIGEALVKNNVISEEDWVGVSQFMSYELASARKTDANIIRPTHDYAMKRIVPDPEHKAEIYYFFALNCHYCRQMAPDVERLWRVAKGDPNLKMAALALGETAIPFVNEFKKYTGMTMPIFDGMEAAKALRVGFVPALVVVSPTEKVSYVKTGRQEFERMYEFVRTVQGLPAELAPGVKRLMLTPIGEIEKKAAEAGEELWKDRVADVSAKVVAQPPKRKDKLEQF